MCLHHVLVLLLLLLLGAIWYHLRSAFVRLFLFVWAPVRKKKGLSSIPDGGEKALLFASAGLGTPSEACTWTSAIDS